MADSNHAYVKIGRRLTSALAEAMTAARQGSADASGSGSYPRHRLAWNLRLRKLEWVRRRIPYAYWLFYDAVIVWALLSGNAVARAVAFLCLAVAVFFDVVEFAVKGMESHWLRRLFEGTGPPIPK